MKTRNRINRSTPPFGKMTTGLDRSEREQMLALARQQADNRLMAPEPYTTTDNTAGSLAWVDSSSIPSGIGRITLANPSMKVTRIGMSEAQKVVEVKAAIMDIEMNMEIVSDEQLNYLANLVLINMNSREEDDS